MEHMLLDLDLEKADDEELNGIFAVPIPSRAVRQPLVFLMWQS